MIHARDDYNRIQDPHGKIPADEPVFLIRGQNDISSRVVRHWAMLNEAEGGDKRLSELARKHADLMDAWPVKKPADL